MKLTFDLDVGLNLKYLRLQRSYSLRDLSKALDSSHTLVSKLEMSRIGLSDSLKNKYQTLFGCDFNVEPESILFLNQILEKLMHAIVRYNEIALIECVQALKKEKDTFSDSLYRAYFDILEMVSNIHTVRGVIPNEKVWMELLPYLPLPLTYLVSLGLTHAQYLNYRFKEALSLLKKLETFPMEEYYKALIYEKQSAIMFFQFNRQEALALNEKAYQIFSSEDVIVRMSLCEIRNDLFRATSMDDKRKIDYAGLNSKAVQFKLYFMTDTIYFIQGLRALHDEDFKGFIKAFNKMEERYPSSDLYYGLGLLIMGDFQELKEVIKNKPSNLPTLFEKGFEALEKSIDGIIDEKAFKHYLSLSFEEKSYEDTMLCKKILEDYYLKHRRYKEAFYLLNEMTDVILKP